MARILIAGCGDVGTTLGCLLAGEGHRVFGLRRRPERLPAPLAGVAADLGERRTLGALPAHLDAVVYAAGPDAYDDAAYRRAYVDGTANLLAALARIEHPPPRWLFVSSTSVYGETDGGWVDETSPTAPRTFSARRLLEGERTILAAAARVSVVRFAGIYGPGRHRLIDRVRAGAPCRDAPPVWTNRIHRNDCAGVLRHLLFLERPRSLYLGVDCEPAPECAVMDWLAEHLGVPPPPREPGRGAEGARSGNKRCSNARLRAAGYRFRYPTFREGYAAVLDAARDAGSARR